MVPENIIIVAASDNHYAILLAVLIKSIEKNHKTDERLDFYVLDDSISSKNKQKIASSIRTDVTTLHWINAKQYIPSGIKIPADRSTYPQTAYLRLFAPYVIPAGAERFIYLDVDMVVLEDISKLWHTDINNRIIAGVVDSAKTVSCPGGGGIVNYQQLGLHPDTKYFNSGIMVIDAVKWRESDISNKVIRCLNDNIGYVNYADQYGLNVVFANKWHELDCRWNVFSNLNTADPYVIHFIHIKPIFKSYYGNPEYLDQFNKYLELTAWKGLKPLGNYKRLLKKGLIKLKKLPRILFRIPG